MLDGASQVKIHGQMVDVRAKVAYVDNLSAHADSSEILQWLHGFAQAPKKTFITHGEPAAADALRHKIKQELGWDCCVPEYLQTVKL